MIVPLLAGEFWQTFSLFNKKSQFALFNLLFASFVPKCEQIILIREKILLLIVGGNKKGENNLFLTIFGD